VKMTEKDMGNIEYGDTDLKQAAHHPWPAVEEQLFLAG